MGTRESSPDTGTIIRHILDCYVDTGEYNSKLKLDNKYEHWFKIYTDWINGWVSEFGDSAWEKVAEKFVSDVLDEYREDGSHNVPLLILDTDGDIDDL
ncbi:uncharacterized protein EI90DRAFT_3118374 [Cantharellus anzutake]|uniref:uncharacterized protein n=1 Tax=Cantharellus anzutake TaxID=1750568 RepID=UPI0019084CEE|nr:uncharacterized protein EI90DRAFT_3118374 [Cantharellus anzutake]KAF8337914.1 hypothetical protein EI90DRAFT_3118374 [Cantharellus anzutake]